MEELREKIVSALIAAEADNLSINMGLLDDKRDIADLVLAIPELAEGQAAKIELAALKLALLQIQPPAA